MNRAPCIAGRATTCWKAYHTEDIDLQHPLVIKDSWQFTEREEEGELLREATNRGMTHIAQYYHHSTVQVLGDDDDIAGKIRKGLDITKAENYRPARTMESPRASKPDIRKGRGSTSSLKRSSSQLALRVPQGKRSCSTSSAKDASGPLPNRVHRRVILRDFGRPMYKASSRVALLKALEGCIEGHKSLREVGFLHRDISVNNLMLNEDAAHSSWPAFLIDLDLAIREQRTGASGAKGKTGTRAFMAIGALLGEQHSFMHDLESFFWVLFWICIHYNGPGKGRVVQDYDRWNYEDTGFLVKTKKGEVSDEGDFIISAEENFMSYYKPLVPWANRLRKVVFPDGRRWEKEDLTLYSQMKEILREAQKDPKVLLVS